MDYLHSSREKEFENGFDSQRPCRFIMLGAFRFQITEIASRLPSFLYKCFIQEFGAVYSLLGFFRIASFSGSYVQPNTDPGFFG